GGVLRYPGGSVGTTRGATINAGGGGISIPAAGFALALNGVVTGPGQLKKLGSGTLALNGANSYSGGTIVSNGVFQVGNGFGAGYGDIQLNDGAVLRLAGSYTLTNNLQFSGTVGIDLNNNSPSGDRHLTGNWSGDATVLITNISDLSRTFTIGGNGGMSSLSGIVDLVGSSCRFRFNNNDTSPNTGSANVHFKLGSGTVYLEPRNGNVTVDLGALEGGPATVIRGRASGLSGTVTYAIGALNLSTVFDGSISNSPTSGNLTSLRKVGTGRLTLTGPSGYTGATSVEDGTLQVDGSLENTTMTVTAGTLSGGGTLNGFVEIGSGATFAPGNGAGTMTINNMLQLDAGSFTVMELNPAAAANDSVLGLTSISYGGTLTVTNLGGSFAPGDTFTLFSSVGGYGGAFDAIQLPPLGTGMAWDTSNLLIDGSIKVVSVVLPQITANASGGSLVLAGTNGAPDATYQILTSTNLASPLSGWTPVETNVFDANGAFSFTNAVDPTVRQKFFILLVP
ncbi:MAG TPA: autotransporter-associated beta strand repeat-containing protein, partial [Candidatus Paceibacterota bacterium]|nr:autotransporter-associated beta strand repeat-containing protein [Candidatus Paceibacterota bacterium]